MEYKHKLQRAWGKRRLAQKKLRLGRKGPQRSP